MAWTDVVINGLLVKEARKDSKYGSEDLRYVEWISMGIGAILPVIIGLGILRTLLNFPMQHVFYLMAGIGVITFITALFLKESQAQIKSMERMSR